MNDGSVNLKQFVERIERLNIEKTDVIEAIRDVYQEEKADGFDISVMRKLISMRKKDAEKRNEEEELMEIYKAALGMV